jgi:hypothetical protein
MLYGAIPAGMMPIEIGTIMPPELPLSSHLLQILTAVNAPGGDD